MNTKTISKGPARDRDLWKRLVNEKFDGLDPVLSEQESISAAKRLYAKAEREVREYERRHGERLEV